MKVIDLWHGGRNLEYSYKEFGGTRNKKWEYGPGLYLTTHYERARSYAKGGGTTYLVTIEEGNNLENVMVDIAELNEFVLSHVIRSKQKRILKDLHRNFEYSNNPPYIHLNILLNLIINDEAILNTKTHILNNFLVEKGADYSLVKNYGGRNETVLVIFNREKIKKVKATKAAEVDLTDYEKTFIFTEHTSLLKI